MRRSVLETKYYKNPSENSLKELKKHKNYTSRLAKKCKAEYFSKLDIHKILDNKKFYQYLKPLLSNCKQEQDITIVENGEIFSEDKDIAETFSSFFKDAVKSLNISDNSQYLTSTEGLLDPVEIAIKKFENHPSIINIQRNSNNEQEFAFSYVDLY